MLTENYYFPTLNSNPMDKNSRGLKQMQCFHLVCISRCINAVYTVVKCEVEIPIPNIVHVFEMKGTCAKNKGHYYQTFDYEIVLKVHILFNNLEYTL